MKITTLIEDHPNSNKNIKFEHGISCYFEADGISYLFDTGLTGLFLSNFDQLGIDPNSVQKIVISHGHNDHAGGLMKYLKSVNIAPEIYLGKGFFNDKYKILPNGKMEYKSCGFTLKDLEKYSVIEVDENVKKVSDNVYLFSKFSAVNDFEKIPGKYVVKKGSEITHDTFGEEISIGINTPEGIVLIVGCSHVGIVNIVDSILSSGNFKIRGIIGGTHLINCSKDRLEKTLEYLNSLNLEFIAVSHCTGDENMEEFKKVFQERFILNNSGNTIDI